MTECPEKYCTEGIAMCMGEEGCNGYGVLTMGGRRYRLRGQGRNIGATAQPHERCNGTGMVPCGCRELVEEEELALGIRAERHLTLVKGAG